ncbi:hypothetical protein EUA93_14875 [Nocardioides oleivorans]|uniref:Peptidase MA-like domain-containing protein n=1 Tax=Nocardioides oleivorans TaxID=273676 RepID=A0A4V1RLE6_9ACTN|nr:hypothetical protein [Nocardioides oleivorans]RYB95512.1 hypothetical protein EUA93_14875 [Nocardioides oleivorans]
MVALVAVLLTRDGRHEVDTRPVDAPRASPAEAAEALASFVAAVGSRDRDALTALAPPDDATATDVLAGIADNAETLDLDGVTARYVDQVGTVDAGGRWSGVVELTWQLGGFDAEPSSADVVATFAPAGDGLGIASFGAAGAAGTRTPLWLRGRLSVVRGSGVLVMVDGARAQARAVADRARRGADVVRRVLPGWRGRAVVEVPASAADLDETLGAGPGTYAAIAGVTATAGEGTGDDAPVHVFVNPDVTDGLRPAGAQVVMSHELTHLAVDAARTPLEPWLLEGFADYVALRDTGLSDRTTLGRAIAAVRRDGQPRRLPDAADFDTRVAGLQASYEEAWLACRIVAERLGEQGLVTLYDAVAGGAALDRALRARGLPVADLTSAWRSRLASLAR